MSDQLNMDVQYQKHCSYRFILSTYIQFYAQNVMDRSDQINPLYATAIGLIPSTGALKLGVALFPQWNAVRAVYRTGCNVFSFALKLRSRTVTSLNQS